MQEIKLSRKEEAKRTEGRVCKAFRLTPKEVKANRDKAVKDIAASKSMSAPDYTSRTQANKNKLARRRKANAVAKQSRKVNR